MYSLTTCVGMLILLTICTTILYIGLVIQINADLDKIEVKSKHE